MARALHLYLVMLDAIFTPIVLAAVAAGALVAALIVAPARQQARTPAKTRKRRPAA